MGDYTVKRFEDMHAHPRPSRSWLGVTAGFAAWMAGTRASP
jgi:hypothetical protein